jgi:hypothetical protein
MNAVTTTCFLCVSPLILRLNLRNIAELFDEAERALANGAQSKLLVGLAASAVESERSRKFLSH